MSGGDHGIHIHEKSDFSNGCASAGGHYNPFNKTHGGRGYEVRHVGDMGSISLVLSDPATLYYIDDQIKLTGDYSVIGRSVVVHQDADDNGMGGFDDS